MSFPLTIYALAFVAAAALTAAGLPFWRGWCLRRGFVDDPGHRKIHDRPVPLAGGLAVLTGVIIVTGGGAATVFVLELADGAGPTWTAAGLGVEARGWLAYGFTKRSVQLAVLFLGALAMTGLGWWDDRRELRPAVKFCAQLLVALAVAAAGIRVTLFVDSLLFSYTITILWIVTVTNACNFMDNMNGLCGGLGLIAAWTLAAEAAGRGQYLVAALGFAAAGALAGFLPFNFPRGSVFLGDSGSHLVGYWLAVLAILPTFYEPAGASPLAVLKPLLILGVILGDLVWVVILRWRLGRPVYVGDTNHLSHRLVRRGLSPARAVLVIWLVASALGALASAW